MSTMDFERGVAEINDAKLNEVLASAKRAGVVAYVLPDAGITNRQSFFEAVRTALPLDPALIGNESWDALSDSLWGGLDRLDACRIAIIWPNSSAMHRHAPADYELALAVLADLAASLANETETDGNEKQVSVLICK